MFVINLRLLDKISWQYRSSSFNQMQTNSYVYLFWQTWNLFCPSFCKQRYIVEVGFKINWVKIENEYVRSGSFKFLHCLYIYINLMFILLRIYNLRVLLNVTVFRLNILEFNSFNSKLGIREWVCHS